MSMPYRPLVNMAVEPRRPEGAQCRRCGNIPFRSVESAVLSSLFVFKCHVCGQPLRGGLSFVVLDILSYLSSAAVVFLAFRFSKVIYSILDFEAHYFVAIVGAIGMRILFTRIQARFGRYIRAF